LARTSSREFIVYRPPRSRGGLVPLRSSRKDALKSEKFGHGLVNFGKLTRQMLRAKSLVHLAIWWSRWDSNPRPLRCELHNRQNAEYLPFRKLQPPKKIKGFYILSHSSPSLIRGVLFFLVTYWSHGRRLFFVIEHAPWDSALHSLSHDRNCIMQERSVNDLAK